MELNEFEHEMLDALLEAFGSSDSLTREQILKLFDGDENFASDIADALTAEGLVAATGVTREGELPVTLIKLPKADDFLKEGGFFGRVSKAVGPKKPVWDEEYFRKRNTELQNEILKMQRTIRDSDAELLFRAERIQYLKKYKYLFYVALALIACLSVWIIWSNAHVPRL